MSNLKPHKNGATARQATAELRSNVESKETPNPAFVKSVKKLDKSDPDYYKKLGKIIMKEDRDLLKKLADS